VKNVMTALAVKCLNSHLTAKAVITGQ